MSHAAENRSDAEAKASLLLRLRVEGIRDIAVLRAMEAVPRAAFAPNRYADLAGRDMALPIGCGQTMSEPVFVARVLEALGCRPESRVLQVGAGSGYATALLGLLAGTVLAAERYRQLVAEAQARLAEREVGNATLVWADGLAELVAEGPFDRIVVHAVLEQSPAPLLDRLAPEGVMIYPVYTAQTGGRVRSQVLMRTMRERIGTVSQTLDYACRLQAAGAGRAQVL